MVLRAWLCGVASKTVIAECEMWCGVGCEYNDGMGECGVGAVSGCGTGTERGHGVSDDRVGCECCM